MSIPKPRLIIFGIGAFLVLLVVLVFLGVIPGLRTPDERGRVIKLTFWGTDLDPTVVGNITGSLGKRFEITYRSFPEDRYETELIDALAAGRGPDVFMVHSSWIPKHFDKLSPVSGEQLSLTNFRTLYGPGSVVEQDFAPDGVIYALPLSIDTLALFYNRDFLNSAGIPNPPSTWTEFEAAVKKLKKIDATGRLIRAGAAIGGSAKSIPHEPDLLSALMIQSGSPMVKPDFSQADFGDAGEEALTFYTKFANPTSDFYTWSDAFPNAFDSFTGEFAAMVFGYRSDLKLLREKNAALPLEIAPFPQPGNAPKAVTYASYWGIGVRKNYPLPADAWSFILLLAADPASARNISTLTDLPPALRSLVGEKLEDPSFGIFAKQALTARSWPEADPSEIATIFSNMVQNVLSGRETPGTAIRTAENAVTVLMQRLRKTF